MTNFWHDISVGDKPPDKINIIIETPKGSQNKYEHDKINNIIKLDRVLYSPLTYPGDYGLIPRTLAPDNDPLDALMIVTNPTLPGILVEAKPIGVMKMIDNGEIDDKIICVPLFDVRLAYINDVSELAEGVINEISHFFAVYKELEKKKVEIGEWLDAKKAKKLISEAMAEYNKKFKPNK